MTLGSKALLQKAYLNGAPHHTLGSVRGPHLHFALSFSVPIESLHINENGVRLKDSMAPS